MSSPPQFTVPAGQSPPFAVVTPDDHTAWILVAAAIGLACSLFFGGIRVLVRTTISHGTGLDDYTICAATMLAIIQSGLIFGACSEGLGKAVDLVSESHQVAVQKMYYASNLFFILAIGLSKISVVYFLHRISRNKRHALVFNIVIGVIVAWTIGSFLALAIQCDIAKPWDTLNATCSGSHERYTVIGALDIVLEVAVLGLVIYLVFNLQTALSSKLTVISIFSMRMIIIVFIAFRMHTFDAAGYTTNPFLAEAPFIAWTQSQLSWALISATIPTFQNFLKNLNTGFGGIGAGESGYGYGSTTGSRIRKESNMSFPMSNLRTANKSAVDPEDRDPHALTTEDERPHFGGPNTVANSVSGGNAIEPANGETTSIGSNESSRMMIKKEIQWSVRTEPRY